MNEKLAAIGAILNALATDTSANGSLSARRSKAQEGHILIASMIENDPVAESFADSPAAAKTEEMLAALEDEPVLVAAKKGKK